MLNDSEEANASAHERLSALLDGELDAGAVGRACAQWRESAESRATWHTYRLIGDVLRSDDLAGDPARDAGFLGALRARLAAEPVVLAPRSIAAEPAPVAASVVATHAGGGTGRVNHGGRRWHWIAPTAIAAGFVAVAGVLTLTRVAGEASNRAAGTDIARAAAPASIAAPLTAATLIGPASLGTEPQAFVASGQVIRDARLDRYLTAHKQFAGSSALGVPSAYLRNATAEVSGR
jgi:sigma-E factor negative regulatory protein RseA